VEILRIIEHFTALIGWYISRLIMLLIAVGVGGCGLVFCWVFVLAPLFSPRGPSTTGSEDPVNPYAETPETKP
jgi:hypothetical protein